MENHSSRYYPSLSKQQHYRDDSSVATSWIQKSSMAKSSPPPKLQTISLTKVIFDGLSFFFIIAAWLIFKYFVKPVRRPFLCSDLSLYHPRPPVNVFPTWLLFVCAVVIPAIIILLSEGILWYFYYRKKPIRLVYKLRIRSKSVDIPQWLGRLYIIIGVFVFAHGINSLLTNVGKVSVGRHRPHFIPSCFNKFNSDYPEFCSIPNQWFVNYTCIGEEGTTVKEKDGAYDIRQSFPSGHTSTAFCGLIILALYIHHAWNYRNNNLFPYFIQASCLALASYIGFTRLSDNRHHATDVLAGSILGILVALIAFRYMLSSIKQAVPANAPNERTTNEIDLEAVH